MMYYPRAEHTYIMKNFFDIIKDKNINYIADIGTGRTSLYMLCNNFGYAKIDAMYPVYNFERIKLIEEAIQTVKYNLIKLDIRKQHITKGYDLCLAHLVLTRGEENYMNLNELLNGIFKFITRYLIIIEDKDIASKINIVRYATKCGYELIKKLETKVPNEFINSDQKKDVGYLFEKKY